MTHGTLIWKNLTRYRLRFFLTTFAIFIAFFLFGILQSFDKALDAGAELAADDRLVVSNRINFTQPLPIAYVDRIRSMDGVLHATHQSWIGSYYQEPRNFIFGFAVDPESFMTVYQDDIVLPAEQIAAFIKNRRGVLVGADTAGTYGWALGDLVPISSNIWQQADGSKVWDVVIEGIFQSSRDELPANGLYMHYDYLNEARTFGKDFTGTVALTTTDPTLNDQVAQAIDFRFQNSAYATETRTEAAFNRSFVDQLGNIGLIISSVVGAALFTILIIVGNTMALSIRERTSEIGVMKALGFRASTVFSMVLGEAFGLAFFGGLIGTITAWGLVEIARNIPGFPFVLGFPTSVWLQAFGLMVVLGVLTGLFPAWNAYRLKLSTAFARV
ncbi:ABC transporter substrate-binding protein [Iodidimonas muriae]|uniref:ABC transporter substrate-binding protein n=1 Tax=Iodidimonas muriae TaxID=261467 RepID=A0ABQ2LC37_9PROT|nr:ABC transporter permease [Iodidimonas muriae]GER06853.1 ABC transporter substrate-binding protein [Kordiimonadales bacterium JCM 17843]GGO09765.1 ABC transporter substrate-binding protein [Iodidimonas muriae]